MPCMCRAPCAVHLHAIHEYRPKCILYLPKAKCILLYLPNRAETPKRVAHCVLVSGSTVIQRLCRVFVASPYEEQAEGPGYIYIYR